MKIEELRNKITKIADEAILKRTAAIKGYCDINNPFNIGDIIQSIKDTPKKIIIKIEAIKYQDSMVLTKAGPECYYQGERLRENLIPYKSGIKSTIFQTNAIKRKWKQ